MVFQYIGKIYLQLYSIAMGSELAPALALVLVAHYEEEFLTTLHQQALVWRCYIDNVLVVWSFSWYDLDLSLPVFVSIPN